jgi:hypothetical protein
MNNDAGIQGLQTLENPKSETWDSETYYIKAKNTNETKEIQQLEPLLGGIIR